jgi:hypothetical protein
MKKKTLTESIEQLNRESSRLQLAVERLSSTSRIESIARERLGLDYPVASQMVIVKEPVGNGSQTPARNNPLHSLAKLFGREQE